MHRPNYNELDGGTEDVSQSDRDEAETRAVTLTEPLRKSERNVHRLKYDELNGGREDDS